MLGLGDISGIVRLLGRFLTLGRSDVAQVRSETDELIQDLSKSLVSLHDVVTQVTRLKPEEFNENAFVQVWDYFERFYLYPEALEQARTRCSILKRDVGRITHKLAQVLHTDLGKWEDVSRNIQSEQDLDESMTRLYEGSIAKLKARLKEIQQHLAKGNAAVAGDLYQRLRADLAPDIAELKTGIDTMRRAARHVREIAG